MPFSNKQSMISSFKKVKYKKLSLKNETHDHENTNSFKNMYEIDKLSLYLFLIMTEV